MKNRLTALFSSFLLLLSMSLVAQELPNIVPPSPEAASLGKFTEVPISHYTGLPNISVPITSFDVGGKSFPVGLSYHARGVRVEEIASRVGIGWALNAGGQISRQVRGTADDNTGGYINRFSNLLSNLHQVNPGQGFFGSQTVRDAYLLDEQDHNFPNDLHADQFNLQSGSLSAKFIFNPKDDQPLAQSYNDIEIDYVIGDIPTTHQPAGITATNKLLSFTVTDKDGFRYYYGVSKDGNRKARNWERVIGNYQFLSSGSQTSDSPDFKLTFNSWLLMDVESPDGELVSFTYDLERSEFYRRSYDKQVSTSNIISFVNRIEGNQYQLKEILHKSGKIVFEGNDARQDLKNFTTPGPKELDKIKIYNNNDDLVRTFELNHSYPVTAATSNANANMALVNLEYEAAKRLRLDSISEVGKNNLSKPPYVLSYFDEELPNRFSNSQDLWGYYNGEDNGPFLTYYGTDNRTINEDKSFAGMLESISYPTGGSTKFIFEHNRGLLGSEYDHINFPKVNPVSSRDEGITHLESFNYDATNNWYSKDIVINEVYGQMEFSVDLPTINGNNHNSLCANPVQSGCGFDIRLIGINQTPHNYFNIYAGTTSFPVEAGEYRLIFEPASWLNWNPSPPNVPPFIVTMNWEEQATSQSDALYSSGKRIKKIKFYDSGNNLVSNKEYSYLNNSGGESGIILSIPFFGSLNPNFTGTNYNVYDLQSAVPGSPFNTYQGNTIGYKMVTEYFGDANNNHGKTQYEFLVTKDSGEFSEAPITPPTDNEWLRGLPLYINSFKNYNGVYKQVKQVINNYAYADDYLLPLIYTPFTHRVDIDNDWNPGSNPQLIDPGLLYEKTDRFYRLPFIHPYHPNTQNGTPNSSETHYQIYHLTGGTLGNVKTTETLFDDNENITLVTETETAFDYDKHYQPAQVTSVTSDGIPVIQTFTYPQDLVSNYTVHPNTLSSNPITALAQQHRFVPIETATYKDANSNGTLALSERISRTSTDYKWFPDYPNREVLEPETIQAGKGDNALKTRIEFKDYDADGNVLQVSKADGMDISYIYGYDNTLPVAKIENATYAEVQSYVNGIKNASNSDNTSCMSSQSCNENNLRTAQTSLRNGLPNAMVTTYTYDPLIGVTSMTDPKGYTVYYEYDDLHRLVRVKDEDGKIMSENKYHYLLDN